MIHLLFRRGLPRLRFQFSLASAFVFMTFCAVGTWYWYQRPYPTERMVFSLDPVCRIGLPDPLPLNFRVVQYVRRVRGEGTTAHGPYRGYDLQGNLLHVGAYRNGQPHGKFISYSPTGQKIAEQTYVLGLAQGISRNWDSRGNEVRFANYLNGKLHGKVRDLDSSGNLEREDNYYQDVSHGPFDHRDYEHWVRGSFEHGVPSGQWTWFPAGKEGGVIRGQWRDGCPDGCWEWTDADGQAYLAAMFKDGRLKWCQPDYLPARVFEVALNGVPEYPENLCAYFTPITPTSDPISIHEVIERAARLLCGSYEPEVQGLELIDMERVTLLDAAGDDPPLLALAKTLRRHGLAYDLRYGALCIDRAEAIATWQDPTGVAQLNPPAGSRLAKEWDRWTDLDVIEMPLGDVLNYLSERDQIMINASCLPPQLGAQVSITSLDTPVTMTRSGLRFKDLLAVLLAQVKCKASLRGETIVVQPQ